MNDKKLLALLSADPNAGMDKVLRLYTGFVYSIVNARLSGVCDSSEIEDCVSDVFIKFQRNVYSFRADASVKTYLGVIARNTAVNCMRGKTPLASDDDEEDAASDFDVESDVIKRELVRNVFDEIRSMGHPDSDILIRKYYIGQSTAEIAAGLGLSASNVDTRAHRAMKKLREKLNYEN